MKIPGARSPGLAATLASIAALAGIVFWSAPLGGRDAAVADDEPGSLVELSATEIAALNFADDDPGVIAEAIHVKQAKHAKQNGPARDAQRPAIGSIESALHHSLAYYLDLPPDSSFRFGPRPGDVYTRAEMIASCSLFLKIVRRSQSRKLRARDLARRFRVFESRSPRGKALFTGYYTPRLHAVAKARSAADLPVYGPPADLVRVDIQRFVPEYSGPPIFGRIKDGRLAKYFTQKAILFEDAVAANTPLFYLNAADFYHLQLQGGALIRFETSQDSSAKEGADQNAADQNQATYYEYAADNGLDFKSPGKKFSAPRATLRRRARENPQAFRKGLAKNPRYIFFRAQSSGPSGSLKTPLTPGRSIAMDTKLIRGGVPAFVMSSSRTHTVHRFAVVQDTGNAIRGHGRVDFYWGDDAAAENRATRFKQSGRVFLFVARK